MDVIRNFMMVLAVSSVLALVYIFLMNKLIRYYAPGSYNPYFIRIVGLCIVVMGPLAFIGSMLHIMRYISIIIVLLALAVIIYKKKRKNN